LARPRLLMVFTGGTISMTVLPGRGAVPARSGGEILALVPRLSEVADVEVDDFARIPGPHWTPQRMFELARHLDRRLLQDGFAGAVVTHGTDTLEETAYLLDLVLDTDAPVVVTGAMKTADDPSWDGPANLLAAARCASDPAAGGRGVLVVLDDTIFAAAGAEKTHTESFGAFADPRRGPLGDVHDDGVRFDGPAMRRERIHAGGVEPDVALVTAAVGVDARPILHALDDGAKGIVVEAMGRGNVPPGMVPAVRRAVASGVPVVVASRCQRGRTGPRYGYDGGGLVLQEAGAVFAGDLSAAKARIKLMVLLGARVPPGRIGDAFAP
jgi:L-asparaginase